MSKYTEIYFGGRLGKVITCPMCKKDARCEIKFDEPTRDFDLVHIKLDCRCVIPYDLVTEVFKTQN
jgi:hypothetical protein